jgi:Eco29kI restriction endonuclease
MLNARQTFDRTQHLYTNDAFAELVRNAIRFFNGTPVHTLPFIEMFLGTGVYALYYTRNDGVYSKYGELNRLAYNSPIYIGKAVPEGSRQSRITSASQESRKLCNRLREHQRNLEIVSNLELRDFACRFMIFEDNSTDMIGTIEAALIQWHRPLWNTTLDGFGNHDPGRGRYQQAKSDWDVIHAGRAWAERCLGISSSEQQILERIANYFEVLEGQS